MHVIQWMYFLLVNELKHSCLCLYTAHLGHSSLRRPPLRSLEETLEVSLTQRNSTDQTGKGYMMSRQLIVNFHVCVFFVFYGTDRDYRTRVYFNACCKPSPLLDPSKVLSKLPFSLGPRYRMDVTLQAVLKQLLDLCSDPVTALDCLPSTGSGMLLVTTTATGKLKSKGFCCPSSSSEFWSLLLKYVEALGCCKNFVSSRKPLVPCLLCHPLGTSIYF